MTVFNVVESWNSNPVKHVCVIDDEYVYSPLTWAKEELFVELEAISGAGQNLSENNNVHLRGYSYLKQTIRRQNVKVTWLFVSQYLLNNFFIDDGLNF